MMTGHLDWEMAKSVSCLNSNDKKKPTNTKTTKSYTVCTIFWGPDPKANEDNGSIFDKFHRQHMIRSMKCLKISGLILLPNTLSWCKTSLFRRITFMLPKPKLYDTSKNKIKQNMNLWLKLWCKKQILLGKTKIFSSEFLESASLPTSSKSELFNSTLD